MKQRLLLQIVAYLTFFCSTPTRLHLNMVSPATHETVSREFQLEQAHVHRLLADHADELKREQDRAHQCLSQHNRQLIAAFRGDRSNNDIIHDYGQGVLEFSWLPGYLIKTGSSRVECAHACAQSIKQYKLQHLMVPEKWLYYVPHHREPFVIVKKVEETRQKPMSKEQAQDLATLVETTRCGGRYFEDLHDRNLLHTQDGKIALIDTEQRTFNAKTPDQALESLLFHQRNNPPIAAYLAKRLATRSLQSI